MRMFIGSCIMIIAGVFIYRSGYSIGALIGGLGVLLIVFCISHYSKVPSK